MRKKNDYGNRNYSGKNHIISRKKCAHTEKKEHRKNNEKKKIKGKEKNKMEYQYSISFKTLYCNLTAI